jgi:hypothetical protein
MPDGDHVACAVATTQVNCTALGFCRWEPGCSSSCGGPPGPGVCVAVDSAMGCPPVDCFSCDALDETTCQTNPACRADYCQECSCTPTFVGCKNAGEPVTACPALGCAPQCDDCSTLDEQACNASGGRCMANECPGCNGQTIFAGCLNPGETGPCPAVDCAAGCRTSDDCQAQGGGVCSPPGTAPFCGACMPPQNPCNVDADCQMQDPSTVCGPDPGQCSCGGSTCIPACQADGDCAPEQACGSDGHCGPRPCTSSAGCPSDFACVNGGPPGAQATCQRIACAADTDCGGGFCVSGYCYDSLGFCQQPVP